MLIFFFTSFIYLNYRAKELGTAPGLSSTHLCSICVPRDLSERTEAPNGGGYAACLGGRESWLRNKIFWPSSQGKLPQQWWYHGWNLWTIVYLSLVIAKQCKRASKTPVSHSICSALEQSFKIRPCVCKSSAMQKVPSGLDLFHSKLVYFVKLRRQPKKLQGICTENLQWLIQTPESTIPVQLDSAKQCTWSQYGSRIVSERGKMRNPCWAFLKF